MGNDDFELGILIGLIIGGVIGLILGAVFTVALRKPLETPVNQGYFKYDSKYYIIQESLTEEEFKQKKLEILKGE